MMALTRQQRGPESRRCSAGTTVSPVPGPLVSTLLTQDDQVTSAPSAVRVSMSTAVWMVLSTERQHGPVDGLRETNSHVQTSRDASTLQGLLCAVLKIRTYQHRTEFGSEGRSHLLPHVHEARHLMLACRVARQQMISRKSHPCLPRRFRSPCDRTRQKRYLGAVSVLKLCATGVRCLPATLKAIVLRD